MIMYEWVVIDPRFDRPFFSSSPPPATLERTKGMEVIRLRYDVEGTPVDREVQVTDAAHARVVGKYIFDQAVKAHR